jgi:hypothetical protein
VVEAAAAADGQRQGHWRHTTLHSIRVTLAVIGCRIVRARTGVVPPVPLCHCQRYHGPRCVSCGLYDIYIY